VPCAAFLVILGVAVYSDKIHKPLKKVCNASAGGIASVTAEWEAGFALAIVAMLFYLFAAGLAIFKLRTGGSKDGAYNAF
jgi:hypothetical protein